MKKLFFFLITIISLTIHFNCKKEVTCPDENYKFGWVQNNKAFLLEENNLKSPVLSRIPKSSRIKIISSHYVRTDTYQKSSQLVKVKYKNIFGWTSLGNLFPRKEIPGSAAEQKKSGIPSLVTDLVLGNDDSIEVKKIVPCMKNLTDIHISSEKFLDVIELAENLPKVKSLYISCRGCDIPSGIGNLKNLESLHVANGVEEIPSSIGRLKKLKILFIMESSISELPEEIGELESLEHLTIRYSKNLTALPKNIGNLKNLVYIAIFGNNIKHFPKELENLTNLNSYHFSDNNFKDIPIPISITIRNKHTDLPFHPNWGIGIIQTSNVPPAPPGGFPGNVFSTKKISLYDKPWGKKIGYIYSKQGEIYFSFENSKEKSLSNELAEIAYSEYYLMYYQKKSNFVRVLYNSTKTECWIPTRELKRNNYYLNSWQNFIKNRKFSYYIADRNGLNLHGKPDTKSKVIVFMKNNNISNFFVTPTGGYSGLWAECTVTEQEPADCNMGKVKKEYKGWFKYLDDKLYPKLWYNPKGC